MNKIELLKKYNEEDRLILSKILDNINFTREKKKITDTNFLNMYEQKIISELLKKIEEKNYVFYGGIQEAERKILIIYPEKLESIFQQNITKIENSIKVIRIELPNENIGKYNHKNYLSGLMKLGIKREKVGDIIVDKLGADIILKKEIFEFLLCEIPNLKRFSKSKIHEIKVDEIRKVEEKKEEIKIIVSSLRLDCIVSKIANLSRNKAIQLILAEKVFVNYSCETKASKEIMIGDIINIRGKGRFTIIELMGKSKKEKLTLKIEKFK